MAKKKSTKGRTARPKYAKALKELADLTTALEQISKDDADRDGELDDVQRAQIVAAKRSISVARRALTCIQDQAAYRMFRPIRRKARS